MTLPCTLAHGRRVKKHTVVCSNPGFLGVVGAYACNHTCRYYRLRKRDWKLLTVAIFSQKWLKIVTAVHLSTNSSEVTVVLNLN